MTRHPKGRKNTGIIGVGEIGKAIVEGLCGVADTPPRIYLTSRDPHVRWAGGTI